MDIKIVPGDDGKTRLYTPYNAEFVERVKTAGGRWDADAKCWTVRTDALEIVRGIMRDVYGMDDSPARETVRVRFADYFFSPKIAQRNADTPTA